jgi:pimeloyl-ACP methyl ester carboxylesterase
LCLLKQILFLYSKKQNKLEIIYAIPGLGTTKELYRGIFIPNYEVKVLNWPDPKTNYTLKEYATKFIEQIDTSDPVNLMGVSFGGMLCSEIAELIEVKKVILISSCKDISEFPFLLKVLKILPVHKLVPDKFVRFLAGTKRRFLGFERSFDKIFFDMIQQMPPGYFYCCINYIVQWDKNVSKSSFIRIHGTADKLLPCRNEEFNLVKGGTHAMVLTKANEINAILNIELNGL